LIQNLPIAEPQYSQILRDHVRVTLLIVMPLLVGFVYRAIAFNNQLGIATIEVSDIVSKLMLSSEFESE
jgi:hypothetical protein